MPSPFPGMDPYLESPRHWRGLHDLFIAAMTAQLNASLPEGYVANLDVRLYVLWEERAIYPDVALIRTPAHPGNAPRHLGGTALREAPDALLEEDEALEVTLLPDQQRESYIEIFQLADIGSSDERLVALIEVLSPANKSTDRGRDEYLRKQQSVLNSPVHLLEIDLLRSGRHTAAIPEETVRQHRDGGSAVDYLICLHPAGNKRFFRWWPRSLRDRLPRIHLPLDGGDIVVPLDLQAALDRAYDAGPYRRRVDYAGRPEPPLNALDGEWADALLREKGLRP